MLQINLILIKNLIIVLKVFFITINVFLYYHSYFSIFEWKQL